MIRLFATLVLSLIANAIGLLAAAWLVDGFSINATSFITAVLIFSIVTTVLGPLMIKIALKNAPYLMGGIALVTTLVGLIITDLISSGLSIRGLKTWVLATLIVWIFSVIGSIVLPLLIFRNILKKRHENQT